MLRIDFAESVPSLSRRVEQPAGILNDLMVGGWLIHASASCRVRRKYYVLYADIQ